MVDISGRSGDGFGKVKDAFAENFASEGDVGASVAVTIDGELVVDLWGGTQDEAGTVPWEEDTIINVFSTTKTMSCLSLLVLASRGLVDVDAPVATYWPEFAEAGKEDTSSCAPAVAHRGLPAGTSASSRPTSTTGTSCRAARQAGDVVGAGLEVGLPRHHPGQPRRRGRAPRRRPQRRHVLRRGDRRSARRRLPHRHAARARPPHRPRDPAERRCAGRAAAATGDPRTHPVPRRQPRLDAEQSWEIPWRRAEIPAAGGHGNARSVALAQSVVSAGGTARGVELLSARRRSSGSSTSSRPGATSCSASASRSASGTA